MSQLGQPSMTWHLLWREFRAYRSFLISMVALAIGIQLLLAVNGTSMAREAAAHYSALTFLGMPLAYAIAVAAVAFNREQEQGTLDWLRQLPLPPRPVWLAKVAFPLLTAPLMSLTLAACEGVLQQWMTSPSTESVRGHAMAGLWSEIAARPVLVIGGWLLIHTFVVGIGSGCSLWIRNPLSATLVAALIAIVAMGLTLRGFDSSLRWARGAAPYILVILATLVTSHVWRFPRWFLGRAGTWHALPGGSVQQLEHVVGTAWPKTSPWLSAASRLWWSWRRVAISAVLLLLVSAGFVVRPMYSDGSRVGQLAQLLSSLVLHLWPLFVGGTLFLAEQTGAQRRFLAERGVSARRIWTIRLAGGGILLALYAVLVVIGATAVATSESQLVRNWARYLQYSLLAFSAAQFASLAARSVIVALALAALLGGVMMGYWTTVGQWLALPAWLVLLPALGWLAGSAMRMRGWLLGDDSPRAWAWAVTAPLVACCTSYVALYGYRVAEIPQPSLAGPALPTFVATVASAGASDDPDDAVGAAGHLMAAGRAAREAAERLEVKEVLDLHYSRIGLNRAVAAEAEHALVEPTEKSAELLAAEPYESPRHTAWQTDFWSLNVQVEAWRNECDKLLTDELRSAIDRAPWLRERPLPPRSSSGERTATDPLAYLADDAGSAERISNAVALTRLLAVDAHMRADAGDWPGSANGYQAALLVIDRMRREGDISANIYADAEEAIVLSELVLWAALPGQRADRVLEMTLWLHTYCEALPSIDATVVATYERWQRERDKNWRVYPQLNQSLPFAPFCWLPGSERQRMVRLDELAYRRLYRLLRQVDEQAVPQEQSAVDGERLSSIVAEYSRTTPGWSVGPLLSQCDGQLVVAYDRIALRRARLTQLRLICHHLVTGHWPRNDKLMTNQLPGEDHIPARTVVDPRHDQAFRLGEFTDYRVTLPTLTGLHTPHETVAGWALYEPTVGNSVSRLKVYPLPLLPSQPEPAQPEPEQPGSEQPGSEQPGSEQPGSE